MEYFLLLSYSQRCSASRGVVSTVNKKTQINSRTYSFLSKLTYMLINIDQQPNIKPPEWLLHTQINTTHSRVLKTPERETSAGILRNTQDSIRLCYGFKSALSERKRVMHLLIHAFNRMRISLVFLNSEAVSTPGVFNTRREI